MLPNGETLICTDSEEDSRVAREACRLVGARTLIVVPLRHGASVKAVLIAWSSNAHDFRGYEVQLLTVLANASAAAIVRAELITQLKAQAVTDELTRLPNRRGWHNHLDSAFARSRRNDTALSVVMLDLDGFKNINDELGHAAGDEVLRSLGSAWHLMLRETDLLGRLGGDEFAVILEATDETAADEVVHRLEHASIGICEASAGIARWDGIESAEALMSRADANMYRNKVRRGDRNQDMDVVFAETSIG